MNSRNPANRERNNLSTDNADDEGIRAKRLLKQDDGTFKEIPRCSKRRYAILVSYCGSGYRGLQINPHAKTIELELATAFFHAGGILDTNVHKLQRIGWSRSARTDKGVHAAMNVVTAKLMVGLEPGDHESFIARCNKHLPEAIRVMAVNVVTKSYNAQRHCAKRRYEYIMPTFMFQRDSRYFDWKRRPKRKRKDASASEDVDMEADGSTNLVEEMARGVLEWKQGVLDGFEARRQHSRRSREAGAGGEKKFPEAEDSLEKAGEDASESRVDGMQTGTRLLLGRMEGWNRVAQFFQNEKELRKVGKAVLHHGAGRWALASSAVQVAEYRMSEEDRATINEYLGRYVGTHKFHNFTSGKQPWEMSCQRYIMSFTCSEPFMNHGIEFVALRVVGQSFMLHQIRKMCGLVVHLMRRGVSDKCDIEDVFSSAFSAHKWPVPSVPPDGLFLDRLYFDGYNKKADRMLVVNKTVRDGLTYDSPELVARLDSFKRQYIHGHIAQRIVLYRPFSGWLNTLSNHYFSLPHGTAHEKVDIQRVREANSGASHGRKNRAKKRKNWQGKDDNQARKKWHGKKDSNSGKE